jgi:hypothetical protein
VFVEVKAKVQEGNQEPFRDCEWITRAYYGKGAYAARGRDRNMSN